MSLIRVASLLLGGLLIFNNAPSQHLRFVRGKVFLNNGDTIRGLIEYTSEEQLHRGFDFKPSDADVPVSYRPAEVKGFLLETESDRLFRSVSRLKYNMTTNEQAVVDAFIEIRLDGLLSLGRFIDKDNEEHFYLAKDSSTLELMNRKVIVFDEKNGIAYRKKDMSWTGVIRLMTLDCPPTPKPAIKYSYPSFVKVVQDYNDCKAVPHIEYKIKRRIHYLGVVAGYSLATHKFRDMRHVFLGVETDAGNQLVVKEARYEIDDFIEDRMITSSPVVGLFVNSISTRNRHLSTNLETSALTRRWKNNVVDVNVLLVQVPASVKYAFLLERSTQPYIGTGVHLSIPVVKQQTAVTQDARHLSVATGKPMVAFGLEEHSQMGLQFRPTRMAFSGSLGIDHYLQNSDRVSIGFRYEMGAGLVNSNVMKSRTQVSSFLISYAFSKSSRTLAKRVEGTTTGDKR